MKKKYTLCFTAFILTFIGIAMTKNRTTIKACVTRVTIGGVVTCGKQYNVQATANGGVKLPGKTSIYVTTNEGKKTLFTAINCILTCFTTRLT